MIAFRSERLEESTTTFSLLRFPEAVVAPVRILDSQIWSIIRRAAQDNNLDPMVLAGIIFVESYGNPLAKSPTRTDEKLQRPSNCRSSRRLTSVFSRSARSPPWPDASATGDPGSAASSILPSPNITLGTGRMTKLLSTYFGRKIRIGDVPDTMRNSRLSYPELFWTNTPYDRPAVYKQIEGLNSVDYSPTYYFRVRQAMRLLSLYRQSSANYLRLARTYQGRFGRQILPGLQWTFVDETQVAGLALQSLRDLDAEMGGRIVALPAVAAQAGVRKTDEWAGNPPEGIAPVLPGVGKLDGRSPF